MQPVQSETENMLQENHMSGKIDQYANFADVYDLEVANEDIQVFYREWRESLLGAARRYGINIRTIVDLACGTGNTTIPWLKQRKWKVIGVDSSAAMLKQARKKSRRVEWYRQDLRKLRLKERADAVTCHFDALDHILVPRDLQKVFCNTVSILNDGGLFQFDMNTEYWFRWLSIHEKLFHVGPHCFMATNEYDEKRRIGTFNQLWFVKKGRLYQRRKVSVQERAYSTAEIRRMLKNSGLRILKVTTQRKLEGKPIRMLYLTRKV